MIIQGNCLDVLKEHKDNSVDSIVTDPPYGLSFMGKKWDYDVPSTEIWEECLRVLKPGGYLLAFAGTRTQHRMCCNIEDAGFEIRDMIAWVYGSGFPKSHNMHKKNPECPEGWGTALKPALEPITVARKPFKGTVANNVLKYGTGGINIDGCRVGYVSDKDKNDISKDRGMVSSSGKDGNLYNLGLSGKHSLPPSEKGRFPANLIHDGSDEVNDLLNDSARFFYCPKANKKDRNEGLDTFEKKQKVFNGQAGASSVDMKGVESKFTTTPSQNFHPTVKPTKLMQYLVRLVTPKDGVCLDPFMGSGSTGKACKLEGFDFIGIEMNSEYIEIAKARIENI